jgi:hypothetical protein
VQRCTVHKHRNLLAHAPERLRDEVTDDYNHMLYARTAAEVETRRKAFIRKWRLKHHPVADSLEEAGGRLFTFTRFPQCQWRALRTTNVIERLHEEFRRKIKTQTCCHPPTPLPCCSGHCLLPARSACAGLKAGARLPPVQVSQLTSPHDAIAFLHRRPALPNSNHIRDTT